MPPLRGAACSFTGFRPGKPAVHLLAPPCNECTPTLILFFAPWITALALIIADRIHTVIPVAAYLLIRKTGIR